MSGWNRQINPDGDTLADELVDIMREIRDALNEIEVSLSRTAAG